VLNRQRSRFSLAVGFVLMMGLLSDGCTTNVEPPFAPFPAEPTRRFNRSCEDVWAATLKSIPELHGDIVSKEDILKFVSFDVRWARRTKTSYNVYLRCNGNAVDVHVSAWDDGEVRITAREDFFAVLSRKLREM
jgi:hypothetical protein